MENATADNEGELTSTMGNVTSVSNKEEKSDTSDATPTSSTDANNFTASSEIASDDPISSTSSDTVDQAKAKMNQNEMKTFSADLIDVKDPDTDLLDISHLSSEKITEDVEDLVHDLESLLGEPAPSYTFTHQSRSSTSTYQSAGEKPKNQEAKNSSGESSKQQTDDVGAKENDQNVAKIEMSTLENSQPTAGSSSEAETAKVLPDLKETTVEEETDSQSCDTSTESVSDNVTNQCIQDQDISRSELKEKDDCDNLVTNNDTIPSETQCSESLSVVDTTVVSAEADTVVTEIVKDCEQSDAKILEENTQSSKQEIVTDTALREGEISHSKESKEENNSETGSGKCENADVEVQAVEEGDSKNLEETPSVSIQNEKLKDFTEEPTASTQVEKLKNSTEESTVSIEIETLKDSTEEPQIEPLKDSIVEPTVSAQSEATKDSAEEPVRSETKDSLEESVKVTVETGNEAVDKPSPNKDIICIANEENSISQHEIPDKEQIVPEAVQQDVVHEVMLVQTEVSDASAEIVTENLTVSYSIDEKIENDGNVPLKDNHNNGEIKNSEILEKCLDDSKISKEEESQNEISVTTVQPDVSAVETVTEKIEDDQIQEIPVINNEPNICPTEIVIEKTEDLQEIPIANNEPGISTTEIVTEETVDPQIQEISVTNNEPDISTTEIVTEETVNPQIQETSVTNNEPDISAVEKAEERTEETKTVKDVENIEFVNEPCVPSQSIVADDDINKISPEVETIQTERKVEENSMAEIFTTDAISATCDVPLEKSNTNELSNKLLIFALVASKGKPQEEKQQTEEVFQISSVDLIENKIDENTKSVEQETTPDASVKETDKQVCNSDNEILEILHNDTVIPITDVANVVESPAASHDLADNYVQDKIVDTKPVTIAESVEKKKKQKCFAESVYLSEDSEEIPTLALESDDDCEQKQFKTESLRETVPIVETVVPVQAEENIQENFETIMAVASLQKIDIVQPEENVLSENEKRELEALRKAVESITGPESSYEAKDFTEVSYESVPITNYEVKQDEIKLQEVIEMNNIECLETEPQSQTQVTTDDDNKDKSPEVLVQSVPTDSLLKISDSVQTCVEMSGSLQMIPEPPTTETPTEPKEKEIKIKTAEKTKKHKKSSESKMEELTINVDVPDKEKLYSPKITIKPIKAPDEEVSTTSNADLEQAKGSLKMTITKQSNKMHSIKMGEMESGEQDQEEPLPKLKIKSKAQIEIAPKMSTRSSRQSTGASVPRSSSPRITIKPVLKPEKEVSPLKIKIGVKPEETTRKHSPKLNIKPIAKPEEEISNQNLRKVLIKPLVKPPEEQVDQAPKITIKPIVKPEEQPATKLTIKPIKKPEETDAEKERSSPKITIKPIVKPPEVENEERIVLKINKGNLPAKEDEKAEKLAKITVKISKEGGHHIVHQDGSLKRTEEPVVHEKNKKQKLDVESSIATRSRHKEAVIEASKQCEIPESKNPISPGQKHKDTPTESGIESKKIKLRDSKQKENVEMPIDDEIKIIEPKVNSPIVISEDSHSQDSSCAVVEDVKKVEIPESPKFIPEIPITPTPKRRGRPRKVPLEVRPEFKEQENPVPKETEEKSPQHDSGRPKRSCRSLSALDTLGLKPRKPRGPGRGRGSARGMGTRAIPMKPEKEPKVSKAKLKLMQRAAQAQLKQSRIQSEQQFFEIPTVDAPIPKEASLIETIVIDDDSRSSNDEVRQAEGKKRGRKSEKKTFVTPDESLCGQEEVMLVSENISLSTAASPKVSNVEIVKDSNLCQDTPVSRTPDPEPFEIVMVDEETRMSAETCSRAQTPAKQVAPSDVIEESQSSVQSSATTESGKATSARPNKVPRLEVQEPESAVFNPDQLTEYYWNGQGPFMLQEQVAQFLGVKSFKRKYPNLKRRVLDMQERDYIKENALASEHMCDLGLTAVNSVDILDIMYSDFQDKYEEYCKHQRDRQAKDLINKQRALTLAASQERNKADLVEQAMQSTAQWNINFNRARREERKACMDLQTLTVHYPKGKMKVIEKPKVGNYPIALVPGQFTDFYEAFTPTELNNLPINTMCYNELNKIPTTMDDSEDSVSEMSESDSESSTSDSGTSSDSSSGIEDCKLCKHSPKKGSAK